jgi:acetyl esterase/lipase
MPESNGHAIMCDLADFWKWFDGELGAYVASIDSGIALDFGRLLVGGDSAGGLMAFQSGVMLPGGKIRAVLGQYPMSSFLRRGFEPVLFDGSAAPGPEIIEEHLKCVKAGAVVSSAVPWDRVRLSWAMAAYGRWLEFYGTDEGLLPITAVEGITSFPPTFIVHGEQDSTVSVEDSRAFVEKLVEVLGEGFRRDVKLITVEGEHGFDVVGEGLKEEEVAWLRDGLRWVEEKWLK